MWLSWVLAQIRKAQTMKYPHLEGKRILILSGHTHVSTGTTGFYHPSKRLYTSEAILNLDIAYQAMRILELDGVRCELGHGNFTRRATLAERFDPDAIISFHAQANAQTATRGFEIWYPGDDDLSPVLALRIAEHMGLTGIVPRVPAVKNMEVDDNAGTWKDDHDGLFETCRVRPCVIVEAGFVSNEEDWKVLRNTEGQRMVAAAAIRGLNAFF